MAKATAHVVDMTNVKDGGGKFNKKHQPEGDYRGTIVSVEDAVPKNSSDKTPMWLFAIKVGTGGYPYYCKLQENQLWKVRNLCIAAGLSVPKKKVKVDPNKLVGKDIAVTLADTEYDGKMQSEIDAVFPLSELDDDYEDEEDSEEEEDEEETEEEEDEEEDEEDEDEEPEPPKKKSKKKKASDDDDELDELDIDDV